MKSKCHRFLSKVEIDLNYISKPNQRRRDINDISMTSMTSMNKPPNKPPNIFLNQPFAFRPLSIFLGRLAIARTAASTVSIFSICLFAGLLSSCVSINLGAGKGQRAKNVHFKEPSAPFLVLNDSKADRAWQNRKNGNSISYLSTCNDPADPTLDAATQDLFGDLENLHTIKSDHITFNGREGLKTEVEGQIDGVATQVEAIVFKKNNCLYTLSYVGLKKSFDADRANYEAFCSSFQAP